ncbi:MAG: YfhO family protein [Thermodesulfobacteriota bacterium]
MKWVRSTDLLAGLTLFFTSLIFFYDILGGGYLFTERDLGPYFIPPRFFWVESIKHGNFPLWNPYQFSGHPFFANPQYAILYPLNGLFFLLPFDVAFNAIITLHFFLSGLFTYLFVRDLKVNPSTSQNKEGLLRVDPKRHIPALTSNTGVGAVERVNSTGALISGLIFMLSGYLLSVHSLLTILLSVVWTPLIMMFFRRALICPGFKNEILTAIFITISFLGGGIEIVYGNFFVLLFMVIFSKKMGDCRESPLYSNPCSPTFTNPPKPPFAKCGIKGGLRVILTRLRSLLIIFTIFLFLSAIQIIPFIELWMHSIRGGGISYQEATIWSFAPKDILLFFLPDAYGYFLDMKKYWVTQCWLKTLYTGGFPFILSLIFFLAPHPSPLPQRGEGIKECPLSPSGPSSAVALLRRMEERDGVRGFGKERKLFFGLILFSLFLSLGQYNPLYPFIFKYVPFFNGIRYPVKFLYIFILVLSITAGLGFQRLIEFSKEGRRMILKNVLIVFSLVSGLLLLFFILGHQEVERFLKVRGVDFPDFNHLSVNLYHIKRFLFYLTIIFLLLRVGHEVKWKGWADVLLIFFLTADLFGNMGFYGKERTVDYFQKTKIMEKISSDQGDFRIFSTGKTISLNTPVIIAEASPLDVFKEKHLPSMTLLYQLHNIWGLDVIRMRRIDDLYHALTGAPSISATRLIDLYGVKYVISITPIEEASRFELIYSRMEGLPGEKEDLLKGNTVKLYRNRNPFPRAWLVKDFKVMDPRTILSRMISMEFSPDKEVLLEESPPSLTAPSLKLRSVGDLPLKGGGKGGGKVEVISESNNRLQLRVKTTEEALLVLSDTYYLGWKVFVGRSPKKIYRANYAFRAVPLTAGTHQVEFVFEPISFKIGMLISLFTLAGIVVYFVRRKWRVVS